ncbi:MAG: heme lyase CcmF/NrfE family subunit [Pelagibacteraceae bacterium]|tara:strand:- start:2348 stop:4231 length:1884 start_codon:yes stop_codon:yes gene_type:complete
MLSNTGITLVILTTLLSITVIYKSFVDLHIKNNLVNQKILNLVTFQTTFSILSFIVLIVAFVISDFSLVNVYENSHTKKPLFYKISGAWGSHEGSLLLWINILVIFSFLFLVFTKHNNKSYLLYTLIFQNFLILGFLIFLLINSNPFSKIYPIPIEGLGLNPILQDPALAIHPPLLYIGFVGSSIYFSAGIASLISNCRDKFFAKSIKPWVLISWSFQTLGITAGSIWAYYELGWGGFWFWDPVENASLMPWFVITALMHSVIVLEKRNSIYSWVIILCLLTFTISVTGTFLVRSGILNSVHTFANDPSRGLYILIFLSLMIFLALIVFFRYSKKEEYNFLLKSKETLILANNWFMFFFLTAVMIGTLYPIILEVLNNTKISVGPPFYSAVIFPFVIPFLIFMALGPKINWIKNKYKEFLSNFLILIAAIILNFLIYFLLGKYSIISNLIIISSIFLIIHSVKDLLTFFKNKTVSDISRIISHLGFGMLILFIGISHNFTTENDFNLKVGEKKKFSVYQINFNSIQMENEKNYKKIVGEFRLINLKSNFEEILYPEIRIYEQPETLTYEASIKTKLSSDIYLTMSNISRSDYYNIKFQNKPFMIWIWISAILIASGGFIRLIKIKTR